MRARLAAVGILLVIIAGGFGKRLRPLTLTRPKALIPLVDRPLVLHLLDSLPPSCDEAIIAVNYLFEQVRDFFREHESRIAVRVVDEPTPLGTGKVNDVLSYDSSNQYFATSPA